MTRQAIGALMLFAVFTAIFVVGVLTVGLIGAITAFVAAGAICGVIIVAVNLLAGDS